MNASSDNGTPWLSILVPVYNVADWIGACVQSIATQHLDGVEVLLLDDGSTDASRAICEQLCAAHPGRLRLLAHATNRGLSAARNSLLEVARGEYFWFVDGDDEMQPGAIARLHDIVSMHAPDVVMCDYSKLGRQVASFHGPQRVLCRNGDALLRGLFTSRRMHVWTKVTRRTLWDGGQRFPESGCFEDIATMPWLFLRASSHFYIAEPWITYRVREGSITHSAARKRGFFDVARNDDLAHALAGFADDARAALPNLSAATVESISQFCAKEFTKIGWRLIKHRLLRDDWKKITGLMARYRFLTESASPLPFSQVATMRLRKGQLVEYLRLQLFRFIGRRRRHEHGAVEALPRASTTQAHRACHRWQARGEPAAGHPHGRVINQ